MSLPPRELAQPRTDPEAESITAEGTSAFGRLYTEYFDGLYDFVARIVRDDDLAGEIVQTTFRRVLPGVRLCMLRRVRAGVKPDAVAGVGRHDVILVEHADVAHG